ncbi:hypothetical protein pb186bvf_010903 [Paramecium bursaria]
MMLFLKINIFQRLQKLKQNVFMKELSQNKGFIFVQSYYEKQMLERRKLHKQNIQNINSALFLTSINKKQNFNLSIQDTKCDILNNHLYKLKANNELIMIIPKFEGFLQSVFRVTVEEASVKCFQNESKNINILIYVISVKQIFMKLILIKVPCLFLLPLQILDGANVCLGGSGNGGG